MSAKKKTSFFKVLLTIVIVLAVIVFIAEFALERAAKLAFNAAAPSFLGVQKASVEKIDLRLFRAPTFTLKGLVIGNPEGFQTPSLFELESVMVDVDHKSLATDTVVINSIEVRGTDLTYEQRLKSNISALLDHFESDKEKAEKDDSAPAKKVVIRDLRINDTTLHLAVIGTGSHSAPIPLPPLHLTGIGEPKDDSDEAGTSFSEAFVEVLKAVLSSVTSAIGNVAGYVADGAVAAASAVADGAKALTSFLPFGGDDEAASDDDASAESEISEPPAVPESEEIPETPEVPEATEAADIAAEAAATADNVAEDAASVGSAIADGAKAITSLLPFGSDDEEAPVEEEEAPAPAE